MLFKKTIKNYPIGSSSNAKHRDENIQNVTISFVRSVAPKLLGNYPKNSAISVIDPSINPTMTN